MSRGRSLLLGGEVALLAITLAVVLGMSRLFVDGGWLAPLVANAVAAHLVVTVARRRGLTVLPAAALTSVAALVVISWASYASTTAFGLPTGHTFSSMRLDLDRAWSLYQSVVAPAPVEVGFVVASSIAVWCIAFAADWAAFRLGVPFEATLPAGTLFLFTALLGAERGQVWAVGVFAAAVTGFLLVHRTARQDHSGHWVEDRRTHGRRSLLLVGTGLGAVAVLAGTLLGPVVPGADLPGVIDPRAGQADGGSRVTISPLVDIRSRLVNQSNVEVFRVRSPRPSYWRLTSLDRFDGRIWSSTGSYAKAEGNLPEALPSNIAVESFEQTFTIKALAAIWLPSAYEPRALDTSDLNVLYEKASATLIVDRQLETSDGLVYRVTSASPRITAADLAGDAGPLPREITDRYLGLPKDFSPRVRALARDLTASSTSPYAAALALQNHLRTFTYDLTVPPGHSADVLEQFLFDTKRGYCEQFAGSFAAMARSLGLPARVAVGFTQGEADPADPGVFVVRGEHAHAWPEVFFAGAGWVSFEPTPGRGQPFAEAYTGVPVSQAATADPSSATAAPATTIADPAPTIPGSADSRPDVDLKAGGAGDQGKGRGNEGLLGTVGAALRRAAPFTAGAIAAYVVALPLALVARRRMRRRRARSPSDRIALAWRELAESAELLGYREQASDTFHERAVRLTTLLPDPACAAQVQVITHHHERAVYSSDGVADHDAQTAEVAGAALRASARGLAPLRTRLARWFDPRPWLRGRRVRLVRQRRITTTVRADLEAERSLVSRGDRR